MGMQSGQRSYSVTSEISPRGLLDRHCTSVIHHTSGIIQIDAVWKDLARAKSSRIETAGEQTRWAPRVLFSRQHLKPKKDVGAFITASEWLDVNYGSLVRSLMLGELGGKNITVIEPTAQPFPMLPRPQRSQPSEIGAEPKTVSFQRVDDLASLGKLGSGRTRIRRDRLATEKQWSHLTRVAERPPGDTSS